MAEPHPEQSNTAQSNAAQSNAAQSDTDHSEEVPTNDQLSVDPCALLLVDLADLSDTALVAYTEALLAHHAALDARRLETLERLRHRQALGRNRGAESRWLAQRTRRSRRRCSSEVSQARLAFGDLPALGQALRDGRVQRCHVQRLLGLWYQPRLRPLLERDLTQLIKLADQDWAKFDDALTAWEILVDPTDPQEAAAAAHDRRGLWWSHAPGGVTLVELRLPTETFAQIESILAPVADELFGQDWAQLRDLMGDDAIPELLPRNSAQRLADALLAVIRAGANRHDPGIAPVVNVVIDAQTLLTTARTRDTQTRDHAPTTNREPGPTGDELDTRIRRFRSETISGVPLRPNDVLDMAIAGRVRLFLINTKTGDIAVSRATRLFTGLQRLGIIIRDRYCTTPGCGTRAVHCEIDHITPRNHGGPTEPANAQTLCRACHQHKTRQQTRGLNPAMAA